MNEADLLNEVARRSGVSRENANAVLTALAAIARERAAAGTKVAVEEFTGTAASAPSPARVDPCAGTTSTYVPSSREIDALIAAATRHPLGLQFLLEGQLCAVATMFRTHAFTVEAARQRLAESGAPQV